MLAYTIYCGKDDKTTDGTTVTLCNNDLLQTAGLTGKKEHGYHDLPFHKLSNGTHNMVKRGWYREAAIKLKAKNITHDYYVQCTTWKDKKQVIFLSSNEVGCSVGYTVSWQVKGKKRPDKIPGPRVQAD